MKKRFTDTNKWTQLWFRKMTPEQKLVFLFLVDSVDSAGVWEIDIETVSHFTGIKESNIDVFSIKGVEPFGDDKLILPKFIEFQFGELSKSCRPHQAVFRCLGQHGILDMYEQQTGVFKGFAKGTNTLEDKDKDKDKDMEGEKEGEKGTLVRQKSDLGSLCDDCVLMWNETVAPVIGRTVRTFPTGHARASKLQQRRKEFDGYVKTGELKGDFRGCFKLVCENIIGSKFLIGQNDRGWKADFDWILSPTYFWKAHDNAYADNGKECQTLTNEDHEKGW
jgi:hypothetical protein